MPHYDFKELTWKSLEKPTGALSLSKKKITRYEWGKTNTLSYIHTGMKRRKKQIFRSTDSDSHV
jgi:hypothetical protein